MTEKEIDTVLETRRIQRSEWRKMRIEDDLRLLKEGSAVEAMNAPAAAAVPSK